MQESIVFLLRVQCRRKESSRSLSHLLMSFLLYIAKGLANIDILMCIVCRRSEQLADFFTRFGLAATTAVLP